ncbi:hypothetical protein [Bifidobacterium choloepi]|uniref:Uncharacterized protein n=1 Tax=Bifidobacterium choloepi TaxID=2614131 RepID=A0A6I5NFJ6_9BIFI|nr:hypothetical protein [Bifidobacterium choloepi]NEG69133.1 hypothetical protein [Bifidobacterium choloepi]
MDSIDHIGVRPTFYVGWDVRRARPVVNIVDLKHRVRDRLDIIAPSSAAEDRRVRRAMFDGPPPPDGTVAVWNLEVPFAMFTPAEVRRLRQDVGYYGRHCGITDPIIELIVEAVEQSALSESVESFELSELSQETVPVAGHGRHRRPSNDSSAFRRISHSNDSVSAASGDERDARRLERESMLETMGQLAEHLAQMTADFQASQQLNDEHDAQQTVLQERNRELNECVMSLRDENKRLRRALGQRDMGCMDEARRAVLREFACGKLPDFLIAKKNGGYGEVDRQIVEFFGEVYRDRMFIADRGWDSIRDCRTNPKTLWRGLLMMCEPLHEIYMSTTAGEPVGNIEQLFLDHPGRKSGFEVTLCEGRLTNRDPELVRKRRIRVDGREFDITPHLKTGTKNDESSLRINYAWDYERRRLIIGNIGTHIPNYTTKSDKSVR